MDGWNAGGERDRGLVCGARNTPVQLHLTDIYNVDHIKWLKFGVLYRKRELIFCFYISSGSSDHVKPAWSTVQYSNNDSYIMVRISAHRKFISHQCTFKVPPILLLCLLYFHVFPFPCCLPLLTPKPPHRALHNHVIHPFTRWNLLKFPLYLPPCSPRGVGAS